MQTLLFYSPPGSSDFKIYRPDQTDHSRLVFSFVPFSEESEVIRLRMREVSGNAEISLQKAPQNDLSYSRNEYEELIRKTADTVQDQQWGKVVISRSQRYKVQHTGVLKLFHALRQKYPDACVYLFQHKKCGVWVGATPELLISGKDGHLESMSLAGTRQKGEEHTFHLKEEEEQAIVTRYIKNVLTAYSAIDAIRIKERDKLTAANLIHFVNRISANYTPQLEVQVLLEDLHPTPAVGGWPKPEALRFISEHEKHQRQYYSGYLGFETGDTFAYYVNLRCMQVYNDAVILYAGGGILADSDPAAEWDETEAKLQTLLRVIQATDSYA